MTIDITSVRKGDIVRFHSYALRVEAEPKQQGNFTVLHGRININGCPMVTRKFMRPMQVTIDREEAIL